MSLGPAGQVRGPPDVGQARAVRLDQLARYHVPGRAAGRGDGGHAGQSPRDGWSGPPGGTAGRGEDNRTGPDREPPGRPVVSRFHPDVTVIQTGYWETQDRLFNGAYTTLANPAYSAYIEANLAQAVQIAHSDGGAVILSTSPYFADGTPTTLVTDYNQIVHSVAAEFPYVSIDDLYTVLDPGGAYASVVNGILARGSDGVHITEAGVDNLIEPALNQIIANVAGAVYAGNAWRIEPRAVVAIAHRGEPVGHRENTLPAFAAAVALGADMVEIDLRRTRDGAIVVLHDQTPRAALGARGLGGRPGPGRGVGARRGRRAHPDPERRARGGAGCPSWSTSPGARWWPVGCEAVRAAGALGPLPLRHGQRGGPAASCAPLSAEARIGLTWLDGPEPPLALLRRAGGRVLEPVVRARAPPTGWPRCTRRAGGSRPGPSTTPEDMTRMVEAGVDAVVSNRIGALVDLGGERPSPVCAGQRPAAPRLAPHRTAASRRPPGVVGPAHLREEAVDPAVRRELGMERRCQHRPLAHQHGDAVERGQDVDRRRPPRPRAGRG